MPNDIMYGTLNAEGLRSLAEALDKIEDLPHASPSTANLHAQAVGGTIVLEGDDEDSALVVYRTNEEGKPRVCLFSKDEDPPEDW